MKNAELYDLCSECSAAIFNDDFTSPDVDEPKVREFMEKVGNISLVDASVTTHNGYWDCDSCEQVCIGSTVLAVKIE